MWGGTVEQQVLVQNAFPFCRYSWFRKVDRIVGMARVYRLFIYFSKVSDLVIRQV